MENTILNKLELAKEEYRLNQQKNRLEEYYRLKAIQPEMENFLINRVIKNGPYNITIDYLVKEMDKSGLGVNVNCYSLPTLSAIFLEIGLKLIEDDETDEIYICL